MFGLNDFKKGSHEANSLNKGGLFYKLARALFSIFFCVFFRWKIYGRENIPSEGVYIICSNHINWFDPPLVGCAVRTGTQVCFMAKGELFNIPVFNYLIKKLGAFPVRRYKADRQAIRHALNTLNERKSLGLFPEGSRSKTGELQKPYHGPSLIIIRGGEPVIPVAIKGPYRLFRPIKINIGAPIYFASRDKSNKITRNEVREVSHKVMEEIKKLKDEI